MRHDYEDVETLLENENFLFDFCKKLHDALIPNWPEFIQILPDRGLADTLTQIVAQGADFHIPKSENETIHQLVAKREANNPVTELELLLIKDFIRDTIIQPGTGDVPLIEQIQELFPEQYSDGIAEQQEI